MNFKYTWIFQDLKHFFKTHYFNLKTLPTLASKKPIELSQSLKSQYYFFFILLYVFSPNNRRHPCKGKFCCRTTILDHLTFQEVWLRHHSSLTASISRTIRAFQPPTATNCQSPYFFCCVISYSVMSQLFQNCNRPGSSVHRIFQARILEWVAISSCRDLPDPGNEPTSPTVAGGFLTTEPPGKLMLFPLHQCISNCIPRSHDHPGQFQQAKVQVLVAPLCPNLCNPMNCSPPSSSVQGISRQEYWSRQPFPSPGNLPTQ